ncbi:MAG: T9SS type A sorting domain-containing protein [Ignavibacteriales bacterium]|nr:T9SS type A sorting domain-containing protein [Ignavibacteriales bacterium]
MVRNTFFFLLTAFTFARAQQDTIEVTFRYTPATTQTSVFLVGEFNGWNNSAWPMISIGNNTFIRSVPLLKGGQPGGGVPGAYQYKFYYAGVSDWPNDPLNHRTNLSDHDNSILYVKNPTIYQFVPNQRTGMVKVSRPTVQAYIFPKVGGAVDTASLALKIDTVVYKGLGKYYDVSAKLFSFKLPDPIDNGTHTMYLTAGANQDSVVITIQAGAVQITNLGNFTTRNPIRTLYGSVEDTSIKTARVIRNSTDTSAVTVALGKFTFSASLVEGLNTFRASIKDSTGTVIVSSPVAYTLFVDHNPHAEITVSEAGGTVTISGASSTPGHGTTLSFGWSADSANPQPLASFSATGSSMQVAKPTVPGEYYLRLIVTDTTGSKDTTRSFFTIRPDKSFEPSTLASVPQWAKRGRMYSLFFKGMTPQGTINAALPYLPYIKNLGFNVLWLLPVMKNAYPIDNGVGPGYNITDFYTVAPEYGTNSDFKNFVQRAHQLGLKIVLDVTPNHTSYQHPFAQHAKQFRGNSPYWDFYLHTDPHYPSNGLGVNLTADGFQHFDGWDQLLNYNWSDIDARSYMIGVYAWWIQQFDIDGYRFDVYWGPHNRANTLAGGEMEMGMPVRQALKHIKPDIYLLGETDGTSSGTSSNYADQGGGIDGAYDWPLYGGAIAGLYQSGSLVANQFQSFASRIYLNGVFPGPNASYLRFLENQDEWRIVKKYSNYHSTKPPGSVIFTAPGMPMIWEGQELGLGLSLPDGNIGARVVVDWNFAFKDYLQPHYQKIAQIRAQFPAFATQKMSVLNSSHGVLAYVRPLPGQHGIVAVNFNDVPDTVTLQISTALLDSALQNKPYKLSDLYNDSVSTVSIVGGTLILKLSLPGYGSAIFILADSAQHLVLPSLTNVAERQQSSMPTQFGLTANYPNPFNPATTIEFSMARTAHVTIKIFSLLGQEIATLVDGNRGAGEYRAVWNGRNQYGAPASSGMYLVRMTTESFVQTRKILLLK